MSIQPSNLKMHRADHNVWDRQDFEHSRGRAMSVLGFLMIATGACLIAQAYRPQLASVVRCLDPVLPKRSKVDHINNASEESFPASDPPALTPVARKRADA